MPFLNSGNLVFRYFLRLNFIQYSSGYFKFLELYSLFYFLFFTFIDIIDRYCIFINYNNTKEV